MQEASADVKESGLLADASHLEDGGLMPESPSTHLSAGRGFCKAGDRNRTQRSREEVEKFSACRRAQSILIRQVMVCLMCIILV